MAGAVMKCPSCGYKLGEMKNEYFYGSPFRNCPKCNNVYLDKRYHEIAIEGVTPSDSAAVEVVQKNKRKSGIISIITGVALLALFVILIAAINRIFYFFPIISVMSIVNGIRSLKGSTLKSVENDKRKIEYERQLSYERLRDPNYVNMLRSAGYVVPDEISRFASSAYSFGNQYNNM